MAVKQWTITLEDDERQALHQAVDGRAIEHVLRRLRAELTAGRNAVTELAKSKDSITAEQITAARQALVTRRELLAKIPDEVDPELIHAAVEPIDAGIAECDRLLRDELGIDADGAPAVANSTSVNGTPSPLPSAPAGGQHV